MSNKTVYPYGTDGELPEGIALVNDLVTGGADKALAAQQGVVLQGEVDQLEAKVDDINEYLDGGVGAFKDAVVGSGGVITFNPITLVDEGDALEFCTIRESTSDNNVGNAFSMNGSTGAITVRDQVIGVRNSGGSWVDGFNAGAGRAQTGPTYNGYRTFKFIIENGNLALYQTYEGETTLKESKPKSGTVQIDSICGNYNGTEWIGTLKKFVYTHGGVSKDVTQLDGFATSGDVTINYEAGGEGAKDKIAKIDGILEELEDIQEELEDKADITALDAVDEKFLVETMLVNFPVNEGKVSRDDGSISASATTYRYVNIALTGTGYKRMRYDAGTSDNNTLSGFWLNDDSWVDNPSTGGAAGMQSVNIPEDAKTFVVCWSVNYLSEKGQTLYATSSQTMQDAYTAMEKKKPFMPIRFTHNLSAVPAQQATPQSYYGNLSYLYGLYDGLLASYPAYVTKEECSVEGVSKPAYLDGMNIYLYKFVPKYQSTSPSLSPALRMPKVMIFTGTHPDEYMGHFTIFDMMKMFCDEWDTIQDCGALRTQVAFYIIPCLNPYGFVNHIRRNGNGVDLNRNFPTSDWAYNSESATYSGENPGSEYETKVAMKYILEVSPDVLMDCHTGNMGAGGIYGAFNVIRHNQELVDSAQIACKRVVNQWVSENANFGGNPDIVLINEGYWGATGELFVWAGENVSECLATLTEQSVQNKWENGSYDAGNTGEELTDRIQREQLQFMYESFMQLVETAAMRM